MAWTYDEEFARLAADQLALASEVVITGSCTGCGAPVDGYGYSPLWTSRPDGVSYDEWLAEHCPLCGCPCRWDGK